MKTHIRKAAPEDAQALKDLDTVAPSDPSRGDWIDHWLREDQVLIAESGGQVIGYGVFNHLFFRQGQAEMLMIHRDFRGQRIGELILTELEKLCDTPRFFVTTNQSNHRMQHLLRRMGYRRGGYIHALDPVDPELVFVKEIAKT